LPGSTTEVADAVQEGWLRIDRAGDDGIENFGGWLTTVVSRLSLDQPPTRPTQGDEPVESGMPLTLHVDGHPARFDNAGHGGL
jgi:DNA-directed RNA polymerase specialized sigma24 family protein